jgi:hypothetical protein
MKWLLVLFSLYIVTLSGIPCDCREDAFICEATTSANSHDHDTDHQKQDCPCSPFFACSSSHGVVVPEGIIKIAKPVYSKEPQVFHSYKENIISQYAFAIFQPPRLA